MSDDTDSLDRPVTEIEITQEMIEAGVDELTWLDTRFKDHSDAVIRIFKAMTKARHQA